MKKITFFWIVISFVLFSGCEKEEVEEIKSDNTGVLTQVSVIDALLQGIYDGIYPIGDLLQEGNFGIGTFHALDGEMVILNDTVFQVVSTGEVKKPSANVLTPFAAVTEFRADTTFALNDFTFDSLKLNFNQFFPTSNIFYAVKIHGVFNYVKTRSVPAQVKPYPPLTEVTANQPEFEFENVTGDLVGFYCPDFAKGINVTGFHLHFLNSNRTGGGHILEFNVKSATMQLGYLFDYRLILPKGGDFFGGDFTKDRTGDLEGVEN